MVLRLSDGKPTFTGVCSISGSNTQHCNRKKRSSHPGLVFIHLSTGALPDLIRSEKNFTSKDLRVFVSGVGEGQRDRSSKGIGDATK